MSLNYSQFNYEIFRNNKINWYNRKGILALDSNTNVTIELVTDGVHKVYKGYMVSIIHKKNGLIDKEFFGFDAYFSQCNRIDNRPEIKYGFSLSESTFKNNIPEWYISIPHPDDIDYLVCMISNYVDDWKIKKNRSK
ncbi:hypothetical protein [Sutcliffiella cohnii]|uniref:hypothetical protein n=1 Tax=Sutcliffiella cohnii TaxID=33932 RepID=UPI0008309026|nr:hypothetical protein [Sutcliffiella cohnii]